MYLQSNYTELILRSELINWHAIEMSKILVSQEICGGAAIDVCTLKRERNKEKERERERR